MNQMFEFSGKDLFNLDYEPHFPYFQQTKNAFKIKHADFVSTEDGTGIVSIAPAFGEDDYNLAKKHDIEIICPIDEGACFDERVKDFQGVQVFDSNTGIIKYLKEKNLWIKTEQYIHRYPHCWRTDTPLIYKAVSSWYLNVEKIKEQMILINKEINWIPNHIQEGQFGKWLENARDWCISRNRFWGCPLPVWKSENPNNNNIYVFGSIKEIEIFFEQKVETLHRPFIDSLTKNDPLDSSYKIKRVEDVLDCWFESGSMPFAQVHYPFENKNWFENHFPANFIVEYIGQTRGWFYTLLIMSTALFNKAPFKNCVCHGIILAADGQKLSKRLKNYPDPNEIFNKYGADAMRWGMLRTSVLKGENLLIDQKGKIFEDALKIAITPLYNAFTFFNSYAKIDKIKYQENLISNNLMDKYILSEFNILLTNIKNNLDIYNTQDACIATEKFLDSLNNWYIRRNKNRFWKNEFDKDKQNAYNTLYKIINDLSIAISPLMPLITEEIYLSLQEYKE